MKFQVSQLLHKRGADGQKEKQNVMVKEDQPGLALALSASGSALVR